MDTINNMNSTIPVAKSPLVFVGRASDSKSSHTLLLAGLVGLIVLYFLNIVREAFFGGASKVPGPFITRFTDVVMRFKALRGQKVYYIETLHEKYGKVVRVGPNEVVVAESKAVKQIHSVAGRFEKSQWYTKLRVNPISNVFSSTDLHDHAIQRSLLARPMAEKSLATMESDVFGFVEMAISKMKRDVDTNGFVNTRKWLTFMTADVISRLTFGQGFDMLKSESQHPIVKDMEANAFAGAVSANSSTLYNFARVTGILGDIHNTRLRLWDFAGKAVQTLRAQEIDGISPATLFSDLHGRPGHEGMSEATIQSNSLAYIIAGSETTSQTLTYFFYVMSKERDVQRKLIEELSTLPEDAMNSELMKLPYLNMAINEVMRLYSAAPAALPRVVSSHGLDAGDYHLSPGTIVNTQAYTLHRDPEIFPDPLRFDPDRWENPTREMKDVYTPFGGASRSCLGKNLALMEMRLAIREFYKTFPNGLTIATGAEGMTDADMEPIIYFLFSPKGYRCLMKEPSE